MSMGITPLEHMLVTLGFHLTKQPTFGLDIIRNGLKIVTVCADTANSPAEFRSLVEVRATQVHHEYDLKHSAGNGHGN